MEKNKFVRFGALKAQKQKHYISDVEERTFHSPPAKYGFFAFPHHYIEEFLLMGLHPSNPTSKTKWVKNDGQLIEAQFMDEGSSYDGKDLTKELKQFVKSKKLALKNIRFYQKKPKIYYCQCAKMDFDFDCSEVENIYFRTTCHQYRDHEPYYLAVLKKPKIFDYQGELWHHLGGHLRPFQILYTEGDWVKTTYENYLFVLRKEQHELLKWKHTTKEWDDNFKASLTNNVWRKSTNYDHLEVFIEKIG